MNKTFLKRLSCLIGMLVIFAGTTFESQQVQGAFRGGGGGGFRGGGGFGGGGGFHPGGFGGGGMPNFGAMHSNFGGGSVIHHDFSPPMGGGGFERPNIPQNVGPRNFAPGNIGRNIPGETRNLPGNIDRNIPGETRNLPGNIDRNIPGETRKLPGNIDRNIPGETRDLPGNIGRNIPGETRHIGPDQRADHNIVDRDNVFRRGDTNIVNRDGPDWKSWNNFHPTQINNTVINKANINHQTINDVRNNFNHSFNRNDFWTDKWFDNHPNAWRPGWGPGPHPGPGPWPGPGPHPGPPIPPPAWWGRPTWDHAWGWFAAGFFTGAVVDAALQPIPYVYGSNIVYDGEMVYVNSVPYVSADEYYEQAVELAAMGAPTAVESQPSATNITINNAGSSSESTQATTEQPKESGPIALEQGGASLKDDAKSTKIAGQEPTEWLPMGTFAVVADGNQKRSSRVLQLATSKDGQVRGNFVNQETDKATELYGAVDPKTQRVAFTTPEHEGIVAECGLWNLTQDTVPMLVHLSKDHTEERTLIRLTDGKEADAKADSKADDKK